MLAASSGYTSFTSVASMVMSNSFASDWTTLGLTYRRREPSGDRGLNTTMQLGAIVFCADFFFFLNTLNRRAERFTTCSTRRVVKSFLRNSVAGPERLNSSELAD